MDPVRGKVLMDPSDMKDSKDVTFTDLRVGYPLLTKDLKSQDPFPPKPLHSRTVYFRWPFDIRTFFDLFFADFFSFPMVHSSRWAGRPYPTVPRPYPAVPRLPGVQ